VGRAAVESLREPARTGNLLSPRLRASALEMTPDQHSWSLLNRWRPDPGVPGKTGIAGFLGFPTQRGSARGLAKTGPNLPSANVMASGSLP
jgi:hypothetical protein